MKRFLIIALLMFPFAVSSQYYSTIGQRKRIFRTSLVTQSYSVENVDQSIMQVTGPTELFYPVSSNFTVQIMNTPGMATYGDSAISGLSDTYIRANYTFLDNKMLIGLGVGVPSGTNELDANEFDMSKVLSTDAFRFRLPVFGQGFTVGSGFAYAHPLSEKFVTGFGVNYVFRAKYNPIKNSVDNYDPGDQISTSVGLDVAVTDNSKLTFDLLYTYYLADKIRGREQFASGSKVCVSAGYLMQAKLWTFYFSGVLRQKGKNETWAGTSLKPEVKNSNGPQAEIDGLARYTMNERTGLRILVELRAYGENELKTGDAALFGLGGGVDYNISSVFAITGDLKVLFGRLGGGSNASSVTGIESVMGISYMF
ncbi:hypothetical protein JXJ21_13930 [candidate division KSB1 bacterium]|nr:hypothetical protein [candidate division KSB1 bacterium]